MQNPANFSESQIVFEDNHIIVVNKKVGQLVQGDKTGDESLLELIKNWPSYVGFGNLCENLQSTFAVNPNGKK